MKMISGKTYTLENIFSGDNDKVVIPDLQRDYCWGNPNTNLVGQFVESLMEMDKSEPITMGLLYGYYNEFTPEHLQLCDGQQRLTTLFLLLGVLNRKIGNNTLQKYLISDFEFHSDDNEPYLQYAIRESSLYFLSDLTIHYFLENKILSIEEIKRQPWYLSSYKLDPTVNSALSAIETIMSKLEGINKNELADLATFILTKLEFLFFDMGKRENGEETFVIINTTGEPLSAIQNLKPLIIEQNIVSNPNVATLWEDMETWFWQHRRKDAEQPHTADEGMECFFNVVRILNAKSENEAFKAIDDNSKFPYREIAFDVIYRTFLVYKRLYDIDFSERKDVNVYYPTKQKYYTQQRLYSICPTICYCLQYPDCEDENVKRVYHLFSNMARYRVVVRSQDDKGFHSPIFREMQIVRNMKSKDILTLQGLLSQEENVKFDFISKAINDDAINRKSLEILLADAENSSIFNGQISELVKWAEEDVSKLDYYWRKFKSFWHSDINIDILRRALLASPLEEYPIWRKGYGNLLSLCNNDGDWYSFIVKNSASLKIFLDDNRSLEKRIDDFKDNNNKMYMLVKEEKWLGTSEYKNIYVFGNVLALMKKERTNSDYYIFYKNVAYGKHLLYAYKQNWSGIWANEHCIYSDSFRYNLTLDYYVSDSGYRIVIWAGKHPEKEPYPYYEQLDKLDKLGDFVNKDNRWEYPLITDGIEAQMKYVEFAKIIDDVVLL